jgi:hypothetical protein
MPRILPLCALGGVLGLGACAVPVPVGPTVAVMPGPGKSYPEFQREDYICRQNAAASIGYGNPAVAANQAGIGSAVVGTGLGAAAGALLGAAAGNAGAGAAIGAGSGLLLGGAFGANSAAATGFGMQRRYNITYVQCMAASGNRVPGARYPYPYPAAYAPPAAAYAPPGPAYAAPPPGYAAPPPGYAAPPPGYAAPPPYAGPPGPYGY